MELQPYLFLDPYLIWFFRLTSQAWLNFLLGTLVVAVLALLVGESTSFLASLMVRRHFTQEAGEAKKYQNLSVEALKAGDRPAYEAANKVANDAFGRSFFLQLGLSAAFFWPVPFILAWMACRFADLEFPIPFTGCALGYIGVFILLYIPACLFKRLVYKLPYFHRDKKVLETHNRQTREMKSFADLLPQGPPPEGRSGSGLN